MTIAELLQKGRDYSKARCDQSWLFIAKPEGSLPIVCCYDSLMLGFRNPAQQHSTLRWAVVNEYPTGEEVAEAKEANPDPDFDALCREFPSTPDL